MNHIFFLCFRVEIRKEDAIARRLVSAKTSENLLLPHPFNSISFKTGVMQAIEFPIYMKKRRKYGMGTM